VVFAEFNEGVKPIGDLPAPEIFDALFDKWADEALRDAGFQAEKPTQGNRIPIIVKRKVAQLCEMKICFPDSKPACFRIADSKKGEGGPYNRFTYSSGLKRIYPNYEYLVQIATFRDLVVEYGYDPKWMKFEYHESVPPVWVSVDIGIQIPNGPKIFVEVKETKSQWQSLILEVEAIGNRGVDLSAPDRGNDPLRKAKYIAAGRPDFFVGYCPEGFDPYDVKYEPEGQFQLRSAPIPNVRINPHSSIEIRRSSENAERKMTFINELLDFVQEGLREPLKTFQYLQSRGKCPNCASRCDDVIPYFLHPTPWNDGLDEFLKWAWQWCHEGWNEWPIVAVFVNSLVARFLASKRMSETSISQSFRMEFTGGRRKVYSLPIPPCLPRKDSQDPICIEKKFQGHDMCCDFLLLPFPALVAEVKVAVPKTAKRIFKAFRDDLTKCEQWMAQDAYPFIKSRFKIDRFDYSLAILIDLSGGEDVQKIWKTSVNEEDCLRRGVFARLISPTLPAASLKILDPPGRMAVDLQIITQSSSDHTLHSLDMEKEKAVDEHQKAKCNHSYMLQVAFNVAVQCEKTGKQQGVEIPLASWEEVHQFKKDVIFYIQDYNQQTPTPIKHASPWAWRLKSGGHPLTENGRKYGVEIRFSFIPKGNNL
jgi:hypothetical protein